MFVKYKHSRAISVLFLLQLSSAEQNLGQPANHNAVLKSIYGVDSECLQYLQYNHVCSVRCRGIVAGFWNDSGRFPLETVCRFYRPDAEDYDFYNRTQRCLQTEREYSTEKSVCAKASCSVQCYNDQYGQLEPTCPRYIPTSYLRLVQLMMDCIKFLQLPKAVLQKILQNGPMSAPEGLCVVRCFGIRAGWYHDSSGPDLERIAVQCGGYENEVSVNRKSKQCIRRLQADNSLDQCQFAARSMIECIEAPFALIKILANILKGIAELFKTLVEKLEDISTQNGGSVLGDTELAKFSSDFDASEAENAGPMFSIGGPE
ncbi:general odorant-binding protein 45-like [Uranotaenia lowii]|uniref:general odorant-binding protein 45-like n=1 Tax=Uranotaenia lowii TaxID=190385 RepID=UPI00247A19F8|nr:general odorant-binding protein 45-like [Uranotaenia lowii]